jgi:hypothetical protein
MNRTRIPVWEPDASKGGAPLLHLRDKECPPELRMPVFDEQDIIPWHRTAAFQLVSLKMIAEEMLLSSPQYLGRALLPLVMHGELLVHELELPSGVVVFTSAFNTGAKEAAQELQTLFPQLRVTEEVSSSMWDHMNSANNKNFVKERRSADGRT